ncbi:MAG: YlxM family DNA-binding protein [Oscillospiraceae bacterium]|nr:YlxM family DNA-binding protein [Oscillospiraceae bacterium]
MSAYEMALLFDYYGSMLTEKQKEYFDMRYNQDLSLGEIAEIQGVSRQAVFDNLSRTENLLRRMEENIGCIKRDLQLRKVLEELQDIAARLNASSDPQVTNQAKRIIAAVQSLKE